MEPQIDIIGKHIEITDAMRKHAEKKVSKFQHYYSSINYVEVVVEGSLGHLPSVEIIARAERNKVFIAKESDADVYAAIDKAAHKLERQLTKKKTKERDNKYVGPTALSPLPESSEEEA